MFLKLFRARVALLALALLSPAEAEDRIHVVKRGDTLTSISVRYYGDVSRWGLIGQANLGKVYQGGHLIIPGSRLLIPELQSSVGCSPNCQPIIGAERIYFVSGNDYRPFSDETLYKRGMATDIVVSAFTWLGYDPVVEFVMPWSEGLARTVAGRYVATFPYAATDELRRSYFFSDSVYDTLLFPFAHVERPIKVANAEDLSGRRICSPKGYFTSYMDLLIRSGRIDLGRIPIILVHILRR